MARIISKDDKHALILSTKELAFIVALVRAAPSGKSIVTSGDFAIMDDAQTPFKGGRSPVIGDYYTSTEGDPSNGGYRFMGLKARPDCEFLQNYDKERDGG